MLNTHLPEGQKLSDVEHILQLMDFDGSGHIDLNEFFEVCSSVCVILLSIVDF